MRVGVDIPYLAAPHDVRRYVQAMEELGFDHLGFSEHVCCTVDSQFPAPFFTFDEPWRETVTMATFVAGVTQRIEVNPSMMLMPLYHPVLAAKQLAEIAGLSDGRLAGRDEHRVEPPRDRDSRGRPDHPRRPLRGADRGDATALDRARRRPRGSVLRAAPGRHQPPSGRADPAVDGCRTHRPGRLPEPVRRAAGGPHRRRVQVRGADVPRSRRGRPGTSTICGPPSARQVAIRTSSGSRCG